jgi:hypothetical protein
MFDNYGNFGRNKDLEATFFIAENNNLSPRSLPEIKEPVNDGNEEGFLGEILKQNLKEKRRVNRQV